MSAAHPSSLTGSECGAPETHSTSTSLALGRLRNAAVLCCWLIGVALLAQSVVWALVTHTDLRWEPAVEQDVPLVVVGAEASERRPLSPLDIDSENAAVEREAPPRVLAAADAHLRIAGSLAAALGMIGVLVLIPLLALAVLLATSSATHGVERVVSSFTWSIVLAILLLPVLRIVDFPWDVSALWSYEALLIETERSADALDLRSLARFVLLPLTCLIGVTLVGAQLSAGVAAGLMRRESLRLDPVLEREAGGIKPSSLHASRAAAAMDRATKLLTEQAEREGSAAAEAAASPTATPVAGASAAVIRDEPPPRRII